MRARINLRYLNTSECEVPCIFLSGEIAHPPQINSGIEFEVISELSDVGSCSLDFDVDGVWYEYNLEGDVCCIACKDRRYDDPTKTRSLEEAQEIMDQDVKLFASVARWKIENVART